jgi:thiosulfate dehydrogenase [quinone] large subunit
MKKQILILFFLRISLGWLFFYSGLTKVLDPTWSAAGFISTAKTFPAFYALFLQPSILPIVNVLNAWGQLLLGISLIIGVGMNLSTLLGCVLMLLYYFVTLNFPFVGEHGFLVDDHIIYIAALLVLRYFNAGEAIGFGKWIRQSAFIQRFSFLRFLLY